VTDARPIAWPTAREIQAVILTACRIHAEDPVSTLEGAHERRGRYLAFAALIEEFPSAPRYALARLCGFGKSNTKASSNLKLAKTWSWWRDSDLALVKAALTAAIAETDAEPHMRAVPAEPAVELPHPVVPPPRIFDRTIGHVNPDLDHPRATPQSAAAVAFRRSQAVRLPAHAYGDPKPGRSALDKRKAESAPS
jgi:hypothetical protein